MPKDVRIAIVLRGCSAFPCAVVSDIVSAVDDILFIRQRDDLKAVVREFPELSRNTQIPRVALDAALYRLEDYRGKAFLLNDAYRGSFVLEGVAAALAYWLLDKTLGESVSEAWQRTEMNSRIREFLLRRLGRRSGELASDLKRRLRASSLSPQKDFQITVEHIGEDGQTSIQTVESSADIEIVIEFPKHSDIPPSYGELNRDIE